jgi:hypothetical protein
LRDRPRRFLLVSVGTIFRTDRDILRSLGVLLRRLVQQGLGPVHQPPVWSPHGLDEGVEGVVLPPVPVELGIQAVESVVPLLDPTLQILPPTDKEREDEGQEQLKRGGNKGKNHETRRKFTNLEDPPRGTSVDPQRFVQRPVERGAVVAELLPQCLLSLGTSEVSRTRSGAVRSRENPA